MNKNLKYYLIIKEKLNIINEEPRAFLIKGLKNFSGIFLKNFSYSFSIEYIQGWICLSNLLLENFSFQSAIEHINKALNVINHRIQEFQANFVK